MKLIELDLTGCKNNLELQDRIQIAFDFPEWYGKNWSAFWDLLWSECDADRVIIKGEKSLPASFEESISLLHEILERNVVFHKQMNIKPFSYEIVS